MITGAPRSAAYRRLALAVLRQAVRDAQGDGGAAHQARGWLLTDTPTASRRLWTDVAAVDDGVLRREAARLLKEGK